MIIKIEPNSNGSHANQSTTPKVIPDGWAVVPDSIEIPDTFPFVNIETENGVVISMTAGIIPAPEPLPKPEPTAEDDMAAMLVDLEYRTTLLELNAESMEV